ncbi:EpsG family protein [Thomasclavelia sp.]
MISLFILMIFCFLLANQISVMSNGYPSIQVARKKVLTVKAVYFILLLALILFSGLRTTYNDTRTYMHAYRLVDISSINFSMIFESYGGFELFQILLKKFISQDPQILILVSSIITNVIYVWFFSKYSKNFGLTILSYFVLGPFVFSMAGIKQILAMSFCLFAIDNLLREKKFKFVLWVLFAMTFHPYIICMLILPIFTDNIMNRKMIIYAIIITILIANIDFLLNFVGIIGKDYDSTEFMSSTINPLRVIVEGIPFIFIVFYRHRLRKENNKLLNLGINMLIFNFLFISMGLFFNPIYFARIGTYFSTINAITIPCMLCIIWRNMSSLKNNIIIYYGVFIIYFILDLTKLGTISIFTDIFNHLNLF